MSEMNIVQRMRLSRSNSQAQPRKRQLRDLIQLAIVYAKEGLLSQVESSHKDLLSQAAEELSIAAVIPVEGSRTILKLQGIHRNKDSWTCLTALSNFGVFEAENFTGTPDAPGRFCIGFLERFVISGDDKAIKLSIQNNRNLEDISLSFHSGARGQCVTMFLKCVSVIATLSGFFPHDHALDKAKAVDVIERYVSDSWSSAGRQRQYHLSADRRHTLAGWLLVTEVFKVQVQELLLWKQKESVVHPKDVSSDDCAGNVFVTANDLQSMSHNFCHQVVVEFFAWVFQFYKGNETVHSFLETFCEVVDKMNEKLALELGCNVKEVLPGTLIISALELVKRNAPTMADIKYDEEHMLPALRNETKESNFNGKDLVMRCRWDNSPVTTVYEDLFAHTDSHCRNDEPSSEGLPQHASKRALGIKTPSNRSFQTASTKRRRPDSSDPCVTREARRARYHSPPETKRQLDSHRNEESFPRTMQSRRHMNGHSPPFSSHQDRGTQCQNQPHQREFFDHHRDLLPLTPPPRRQFSSVPRGPLPPTPPPHRQLSNARRGPFPLTPPPRPSFFDHHGISRSVTPLPHPDHSEHRRGPLPATAPRRSLPFPPPSNPHPFEIHRRFDEHEYRFVRPEGPPHPFGSNRTPLYQSEPSARRPAHQDSPTHHRSSFRKNTGGASTKNGQVQRNAPCYLQDGDESDSEGNDENDEEQTIGDRATQINEAVLKLYDTVLKWPIFPVERERPTLPSGRTRPLNRQERLTTHLLTGSRTWLQAYVEREQSAILEDVTDAKTLTEYKEHWKAIIPLEVRAMVQEGVGALLPLCKQGIKRCFQEELEPSEFISCVVEKSTPSQSLINLTCYSTTPLVNKRIAQELQGGTICVGYASGMNSSTDLILIACRRVSWDPNDVVPFAGGEAIGRIELHLAVSRKRVRELGVFSGFLVHLRHLCHFAPSLRMYKAIEDSGRISPYVRDVLFGDNCPAQATGAEITTKSIDHACANYLEGLQKTSAKLDDAQHEAVRSVLANIGDCGPTSSSFSLIHGPPGTGKTTTILNIIGALLHHSVVGHIGREQRHVLAPNIPPDNIQRCRNPAGGIRILVCAPSNKGVDNILERIDEEGIPDGQGGSIFPQCTRIARSRYNYGKLYKYSIDQKALPFDEHIHNVGARLKMASGKARKSFFRECIIVFTTLVSSGGSRFKICKVPFDVVITDEIGQASEPQTLIALTSASRHSSRSHFVGVGDHHQLPPIALASYAMKHIGVPLRFNYDKQMVSIFERIYEAKRAHSSLLSMQYRMCRAVADMTNNIFYSGMLQSPLPESTFDAPFNKGWDPKSGCFSRLTFIDTSTLPLRAESSDTTDGEYRNSEEIAIIDEVLHRIKILSGETFPSLRGQIAVLVPYRAQVQQARIILERTGKYKDSGVSRQGFDILVDSVDSMQGSERDIVIFGTTRSNLERNIGFLEQPNRLNVATSRAKKLEVIIGDLSTLDVNHHFARMANYCRLDRPDTVLLQLHESEKGSKLDGLKLHRDYTNRK